MPVTIKTNVDVEGKPTPNGLPAFADLIAPADAPIVSNLKKAGAIIIGRTNTPELSMRFNTDNPLHGRTKNPWNEDASPGGSSGGASSAAAAGLVRYIMGMILLDRSVVLHSAADFQPLNQPLGGFQRGSLQHLLSVEYCRR